MSRAKSLTRRDLAVSALGPALIGLVTLCASQVLLLPEPVRPATRPPASPEPSPPPPARQDTLYTWDQTPHWTPWTQSAGPDAVRHGATGLEVALDTRGQPASTVSAAGVVLREPVPVVDGAVVLARLDWRQPDNGCNRRAGLFLCREDPTGRALGELEGVWLEVVGVPPGERARLYAARRAGGREQPIHTDGWPERREGRVVGELALELRLEGDHWVARADGRELGRAPAHADDERAWLLLYAVSHANFGPRPVTFGDVRVSAPTHQEALR